MRSARDGSPDRRHALTPVAPVGAEARADERGIARGTGTTWPARERAADVVDDAANDSFPASDPPSWSGMRAGPPRGRG